MMAKRAGRLKNQLPTCYYEGYLEKRSFKDKTSRKLWTCLCGSTLFFFNDKRDTDYIEKIDLNGLISITDDSSQDRNLDAARLHIQMKSGNIKITAPNAEARELWKGYISSVAKLSVPTALNLLPGQIHMLKEAVESEKERIRSVPPPPPVPSGSPYITLQADMPACYHAVSRLEAELLLEREAKNGNLMLRPGSSGNSFAVTTRQDLDGSVFRHYRVTRNPEGGFTIDVDNPVHCDTLHEVIDYLVEKTDRVLVPLIIEEAYEKNISFIQSDNENGERSVHQALPNVAPPSVPRKPVPRKIPSPEPEPEPVIEENYYLNDDMEEEEAEGEDSTAPPPPPENKPPKKAMMPPRPAPRKSITAATPYSSSPPSTNRDSRMRSDTDPQKQIPLAAISELKLRFEQMAKTQ
ncbi:signal-transducing adaptor protein 1-like [Stegastes partitus]|uniref:Signal-transducing adaptor protein 1-like n=1 Tax=Stegastes partitus TaxID=144197 RepID=A0A3B5ANC9_9TELE|nr:PREDICTED: signal-transducing adaptor protein 1-like [Stegastes partitus]